MQVKFVMLVLSMTFGAASYTHSAQLQAQTPIHKEASIIKNVAASLKNSEQPSELSKQTNLDLLIKADQNKVTKISSEESRALASISNKQYGVVSRSKLSSFIQSLFGG